MKPNQPNRTWIFCFVSSKQNWITWIYWTAEFCPFQMDWNGFLFCFGLNRIFLFFFFSSFSSSSVIKILNRKYSKHQIFTLLENFFSFISVRWMEFRNIAISAEYSCRCFNNYCFFFMEQTGNSLLFFLTFSVVVRLFFIMKNYSHITLPVL